MKGYTCFVGGEKLFLEIPGNFRKFPETPPTRKNIPGNSRKFPEISHRGCLTPGHGDWDWELPHKKFGDGIAMRMGKWPLAAPAIPLNELPQKDALWVLGTGSFPCLMMGTLMAGRHAIPAVTTPPTTKCKPSAYTTKQLVAKVFYVC